MQDADYEPGHPGDSPDVRTWETQALDHAVKVGLISAEKRARMDTDEYRADPSTDQDYRETLERAARAFEATRRAWKRSEDDR
jgi:hypothetical protein